MNFDIKTVALIILFIHLIQTLIFFQQYRTNPALKEIKWWLFWSLSVVLGFLFTLLRGIEWFNSTAIIISNIFIVSGVIFLYIGTLKFFDKKVNFRLITVLMSIFILIFVYYTIFDYNGTVRSIVINLYLSYFSLVPAAVLLRDKLYNKSSILFVIFSAFLFHGLLFAYRSAAAVFGFVSAENMFEPNILNIITYLDTLIVAIVWTFGYLVLINQKMVKEIKESEDQFELIFNTSPEATVITRLSDGLFTAVNDSFTSIFGYTREEAVGQSSVDMKVWKNPLKREEFVKIVLEKGECLNYEAELVHKNGGIIVGVVSAVGIELNGVPHFISITNDVTKQRTDEKEVLKAGEKWEKTFNGIRDAIFLLDENGVIVMHNSAALTISSDQKLDLIGRYCWEIVHKSEGRIEGCPFLKMQKSLARESMLLQVENKWFKVTTDPILSDGNKLTGAVHIISDISERKIHEDMLKQTASELKQMNELMVDREIRMVELKKEINDLLRKEGKEAKY